MNNDIEKIFKSSLADSEMPYDPKAWEAMSARLDQAMPVTPKHSFKWGTGLVAGAMILGGITGIYLLQPGTEAQKSHATATQEIQTAQPFDATVKAAQTSKANTPQAAMPQNSKQPVSGQAPHTDNVSTADADHTSATPSGNKTPEHGNGETPGNTSGVIAGAGTLPSKTENITVPKTDDSYCESEKIVLENNNNVAISVLSDNGTSYVIPANKSLSITLAEPGDYYFTYQKQGKTTKENAFKVLAAPKSDFAADEEMLYDQGLPVNNLKSNATAKQYKWTDQHGDVFSAEREAGIHLFKKGAYEITLTTTAANGCSSSTTKTVQGEVNYNLLAVTGFDPTSSDPRKNTFLPYALSARNIPFLMVIIDPKSGETVYQTKDVNQPWNGIDSRTGQMVPQNSTYIWKVTIQEHERNEGNAYKGTITRI